jgi:hypothetical protein
MPNLYGIANPVGYPVYGSMAGNVSCPAGSETQVMAVSLPAPAVPGLYYFGVWAWATILMGATPPSNYNAAFRINGGSDIAGNGLGSSSLIASATILQGSMLFGPNPGIQNPTGTYSVQYTATPTGQAVTMLQFSSYMYAWWIRGPD